MSTQRNSVITNSGVDFVSPLGNNTHGKLAVVSGVPRITIGGDPSMQQLLRAHFERPLPVVHVKDGVVRISYPSYSLLNWLVYWRQPVADLTINATIPWSIEMRGGVSSFEADLSQVQLTGLDLRGGVSLFWAILPEPSGTVLIRIVGGISDMTMHRPDSIPVRVQVKGGIGSLVLDDQHFGAMGGQPRLETAGFKEATNRYEIQISGSVSKLSIGSQVPESPSGQRRSS